MNDKINEWQSTTISAVDSEENSETLLPLALLSTTTLSIEDKPKETPVISGAKVVGKTLFGIGKGIVKHTPKILENFASTVEKEKSKLEKEFENRQ